MSKIKIREGDNLEYALRRFKKSCEKLGILADIKKREFFEKPSLAKKKKAIAAVKRRLKKFKSY